MNDSMIKAWNKKVKSDDQVYILGDFSFATPILTNAILHNLNGRKYMILGNHDSWAKDKSLHSHFEFIKDYFVLKTQYNQEKVKLILSHFPFYVWDSKHYGSIHLYGHVHNARPELNQFLGKAYNVGVDVNNYEPVSLNEIMSKII
jgi:calcineurin-like phosphoesterase family protein